MGCLTQSGVHSKEGLVADSITLSDAYFKCKREADTQDSPELNMNKTLDSMHW